MEGMVLEGGSVAEREREGWAREVGKGGRGRAGC